VNVETVPIDSIHVDPANANEHSEEDVAGLMAKLATFEQVEPLVVQAKTRKVIGGNGRLEAMRRLGWTHTDVHFVDVDNVTATAMGIALNTRKSHFIEERLAEQLKALQSEDFDLSAVGYSDDELQGLIDRIGGELVDDPQGEWQGMPEFEHQDLTAVQSIHVHFKSREDVQAFAKLIGQEITEKTKFIWHPKQEIDHFGEA
jgi:hypothetical protein